VLCVLFQADEPDALACTHTLTHTQSVQHTRPHTHSLTYTQHNTYLPSGSAGGQDALIAITNRMVVKARRIADEEANASSSLGTGWVEGASGMNCVVLYVVF
jgi:hypothetical protein